MDIVNRLYLLYTTFRSYLLSLAPFCSTFIFNLALPDNLPSKIPPPLIPISISHSIIIMRLIHRNPKLPAQLDLL